MVQIRTATNVTYEYPLEADGGEEAIEQYLETLRTALTKERPSDIHQFVHGFCRQRLSVNDMDPLSQATLLCDAAARGNASELQWLLGQGINPNVADYDLRTPLHLAAEECQTECVELLLASGADVNCTDRWGTTPLGAIESLMHLTEDTSAVIQVAERLRQSGGELTQKTVEDMSPVNIRTSSGTKFGLFKAAGDGDLAKVKRFLEGKTCSVTSVDSEGRCALHHAAAEGQLEVVKYLVECGTDVNATDRNGQSAAQRATVRSHFNVVSFLRDAGATPDEDVPKSFEQYSTMAKKWWEDRLCVEANAPTWSETVPLSAIESVLERDYGFELEMHEPLRREIDELETLNASGASEIMRSTFMRVVLNTAMRKGAVAPTARRRLGGLPSAPSLASLWTGQEFRPPARELVMGKCISEKTTAEDREPGFLLSKIVLGGLAVKSWKPFIAILEDVFAEVWNDESLRSGSSAGECAQYIPQLRDAPADKLALSICTVDGQMCSFGDSNDVFSIQSSGKSFAYTLAMKHHSKKHDPDYTGPEGADYVHRYVGREPSGRAFNAYAMTRPDSRGIQHPFNPVTNGGSMVTCSMIDESNVLPLIPGDWMAERMESRLSKYKDFLSDLAGGEDVGDCLDVFESEQKQAYTNYALANVMKAHGTFPPHVKNHDDLREAVDFYLRMCSTAVTTRKLAIMGSTFATFGRCPLSGKRVTTMTEAKQTLAILISCGMCDFSGEWACTVGLPAKSGVSGNIFIVIPGLMGMCVWSPRLDTVGNSVRGVRIAQKVKEHLSCSLLDLLSRAHQH